MLVCVRKEGERLFIGDGIVLEVLGLTHEGREVSIGVEAPKTMRVLRGELFDDPAEQNKKAAKSITRADLEAHMGRLKARKKKACGLQ